jgi:two-component system response regulator CpxR
MEKIYGRSAGPFDRSIDLHVSHLRRKLGVAAGYIKTIRGMGYQFVTPSLLSVHDENP